MARHTGGWVKLWRKAALGDINSNFIRGGLFDAVVCMANLQPSTVEWKGKPKKLKRGELVTSLRELSDLGEVDPKTVKKHLNYLSLRETLSIETSHGGLLIKINNYERYQGVDAEGSELSPFSLEDGIPNEWIHNEEVKNKRSILPTEPEQVPVSAGGVIEEFEFFSETAKDLIKFISLKSQRGWLKVYERNFEYIEKEAIKASEWLDINSHKKPKSNRGYAQFLSGWLSRGWDKHRKTLTTTTGQPRKTNWLKAGGDK